MVCVCVVGGEVDFGTSQGVSAPGLFFKKRKIRCVYGPHHMPGLGCGWEGDVVVGWGGRAWRVRLGTG